MWIKNMLTQFVRTTNSLQEELKRTNELLSEIRNRTHWLSQDVKELRNDLDMYTKDYIKQSVNTIEKPKAYPKDFDQMRDYSPCDRSRIDYCHTCNKNSKPHY